MVEVEPSISASGNVETHPRTCPKGNGCTRGRAAELMRPDKEGGTECKGSRLEFAGFAGRKEMLGSESRLIACMICFSWGGLVYE